MTREEAIIIIERVAHTEAKWPGAEDTLEALDMAVSALRPVSRERVEEMWRGEWQYHPEDYDELTWTCSRCGEPWTLIDGTPDDNNMNFCHVCGAARTYEAVEMVMESWREAVVEEA